MANGTGGPPNQPVSTRAVLLVAMVSSFLTPFISSSINIALPTIGQKLRLDAVALDWVATSYLLAAAAFLVPFGRLADIWGRKKVFQMGIIVNVVASVLCAIAPSGGWLIAFRAVQGIGGAMMFGTSMAILTSVYPARQRGWALGLTVSSVYVGLTAGPLIGGVLTQAVGWEGIFLLNALLGVIVSVVVFTQLKGEWAGARGERYDLPGAVLYAVAMIVLIYAFSVLPEWWGLALIGSALAAFVVFLWWEMKQSFPVLDVGLFRGNSVFALSNLAAFINYSATAGVTFLLSLYLQYIKGFSAREAGVVLIVQPLIMVVCAPLAGFLSDRIEPRIVSSLGMACTTAGLVVLTFLDSQSGLALVIAGQAVLGLGFGFFSSPNTNAVMSAVDRRFYGVASGTLGTMRLTGQAVSLGLVLLLFSLYIGRVEISEPYFPLFLKSMRVSLIISAVLCFGGIFASVYRGRAHRESA